tara:strand:+ start:228 stop:1379 length:1152 start_codon:yes stop_codon:yes gene_type:complete
MKNNIFKFEKEIKNFETQLTKLNKNIRDKLREEFYNDLLLLVARKTKEVKNKVRLDKIDSRKNSISADKLLKNDIIKKLPSWVREELDNSIIIGNSKKVIQTPDKRKYHLDNKLNNLSGGEWTFFLNSIISTRYPTSGIESYAHEIRKIHPSPKPPQLMKEIIEFFTKENDLVFDYFMGVGGTLLGASLCKRRAIGIDLSSKYIDAYKKAAKLIGLPEQKTYQADSVGFLKNNSKYSKLLNDEVIDLILIDPPYGDMMAREKTGESAKNNKSKGTPFTNLNEDLGNMNWEIFRQVFEETTRNAITKLKIKGHLIIFIKDLQPKNGSINLLHADLIQDINSISEINYIGTKIWADLSVNLYPYGYPHSYVSNQIHQYILIFRKG